jgi:hypothetical protein
LMSVAASKLMHRLSAIALEGSARAAIRIEARIGSPPCYIT